MLTRTVKSPSEKRSEERMLRKPSNYLSSSVYYSKSKAEKRVSFSLDSVEEIPSNFDEEYKMDFECEEKDDFERESQLNEQGNYSEFSSSSELNGDQRHNTLKQMEGDLQSVDMALLDEPPPPFDVELLDEIEELLEVVDHEEEDQTSGVSTNGFDIYRHISLEEGFETHSVTGSESAVSGEVNRVSSGHVVSQNHLSNDKRRSLEVVLDRSEEEGGGGRMMGKIERESARARARERGQRGQANE